MIFEDWWDNQPDVESRQKFSADHYLGRTIWQASRESLKQELLSHEMAMIGCEAIAKKCGYKNSQEMEDICGISYEVYLDLKAALKKIADSL